MSSEGKVREGWEGSRRESQSVDGEKQESLRERESFAVVCRFLSLLPALSFLCSSLSRLSHFFLPLSFTRLSAVQCKLHVTHIKPRLLWKCAYDAHAIGSDTCQSDLLRIHWAKRPSVSFIWILLNSYCYQWPVSWRLQTLLLRNRSQELPESLFASVFTTHSHTHTHNHCWFSTGVYCKQIVYFSVYVYTHTTYSV